MKVFISWSGDATRQVALLLKDWLACVLSGAKTFLSSADIRKGSRWSLELAKQLEDTDYGLMLLTRDNLVAPWILFEAGALSKSVGHAHVCTILLGDLTPADLVGPLSEFQATTFARDDIRRLASDINAQLGDSSLEGATFTKVFDKWWPDLERSVVEVLSADTPVHVSRPDSEILREVLELTRAIARSSTTPGANSFGALSAKALLLIDEDEAIVGPDGDQWNGPVLLTVGPLPFPHDNGKLGELAVSSQGVQWKDMGCEVGVRGVEITIYFATEAGQYWGVSLRFHKGMTYAERFLLSQAQVASLSLSASTIWRD